MKARGKARSTLATPVSAAPAALQWLRAKPGFTSTTDDDGPDVQREKARLYREQADAAAMKNAQSRGELLPAAEVLALREAEYITFRDRLRMIPMAVSERLLDTALKGGKAPEIARLLLAEIDAALEDMAAMELQELGQRSGSDAPA